MTLERLLGTALPIIQAPMAGAQGSAMAIAVSNAGGLGSLPCAMLSPAAMTAELQAIRAGTDKPFNLNFFCHAEPAPDPAREAAWRALLDPYYREFGLDLAVSVAGPARAPFSAAIADVVEAFRPPVVSFHFGLPAPELLARVKRWGARVLSSATTVEEALWLEAAGVDAVIAQGFEAGGHRGMFLDNDLATQPGTFALVGQVVRALRIPVIAAGGIADPAGVAAARALGAAGVQVGSAYLLCPESSISAIHRAALAAPGARRSCVTNLFSGRPARGIVNRLIAEQGPINPAAPAFPLASAALAPLRAAAEAQGRGDFSPLWCGQCPPRFPGLDAAAVTRTLAGPS